MISRPDKDDAIGEFEIINKGKDLIFNGEYNRESGVYLYSIENKTLSKIKAGGKDKEGTWSPFFNISPNEDKILFDSPAADNKGTDIYAAEIIQNKVSKKISVLQKQEDI